MSQTPTSVASRSNYQAIFDNALQAYKRKTGKDLTSDPLLRSLETCNSPDAVLALLRAQILDPCQPQSSRSKFTTWLDPTVNVLSAFSETIGGFVGLAYPPVGVLFTGIGVLLSAAQGISAGRGALIDLFERIENIFRRLETYIAVPPTTGMTDAIVKVMVEVLRILGIATKEIKQNRAKKFLKKLVGRTDIEDALQRLEKVTMEEAKMAAAESLKAIHGVGNQVGDKVDGVQDTLKAVEDRMRGVEGMLQGVGDILQGVDGRVKDIGNKVITGADETARQMTNEFDAVAAEGRKIAHGVDDKIQDSVQGVTQEGVRDGAMDAEDVHDTVKDIGARVIDGAQVAPNQSSTGGQSRQDFLEWLSPPDPSINYNVACDAHHKGTAVWFTESSAFSNWKKSGSLLWIYGKPGSGKSVLTSAIIQDIERVSETGSGHMAYFFFDFKDSAKQDAHAFLSSVLVQLSSQSDTLSNILLEFYSVHQRGSQQPSDGALMQCLEKMLKFPRKVPIYLIVDAVDECPDTSGMQSSREKVLELVESLVGLHLPNLRLCITSRPEVDIRNVLEPLTSTSNRISLHDEDGQKKDIVEYISSVVYSDKKIMRWREQDKELVVKTLTDRVDGMFRWVSCQIEALRRCLAPSVRCVLEELPVTLDETYERILQEIPKANRVHAHRLLQCLTVAVRPLRVQELAEVLAVDFSSAEGIPKLNEDWRWKDQEQAVLTACSSLIAVVNFQNVQMVQFSHYSVKEFLTSDRLAEAKNDTLRYHQIRLEPAHAIIAQACIGVLLRLEYPIDRAKMFPLADYAAKHFTDHAELGNAIPQITDGVDHLLDQDKPHFSAWMSLISSSWWEEKDSGRPKASSLYHVADLGFSRLVQHLVLKHPQDVNVKGGVYGTPLHAALHRRHVQVCRLLLPHCADVDIRDSDGQTPLHVAACNALPEVARMIIDQGADVNARDNNDWTPLHQAIDTSPLFNDKKLDIMRLLLERGANAEARDKHINPLHLAAGNGQLAAARLLIENGASLGALTDLNRTPLHEASWYGHVDIIRLLLERGAEVDAGDIDNKTPLHLAVLTGQLAATRLLIENGASLGTLTNLNRTLLHEATWYGRTDIIRLLLESGANVEAIDIHQSTPLHLAACNKQLAAARLLVENGASLEALSNLSRTPLHDASWYGHTDVMQVLLERGANMEGRDKFCKTPLHIAVLTGQLAAARLLIENGASLEALTGFNRSLLHEASWHGHADIIRLLLEHGANVEARDEHQSTPLHLAACNNQLVAARLLVENGASLEVPSNLERTPLHDSSWYGHTDIMRLLLEHGANVEAIDIHHSTPLHLTACNKQPAAVRLLVENGASLEVPSNLERTPLHDSSWYGHTDIMRLLLERGANVEARDKFNSTPLHLAACNGGLAALQLLIEHGAIVHVRNKASWTPLHEASNRGYSDIILLLLEHKADADAQDSEQATPLHRAALEGKLEAAQLLLSHGANVHARNMARQTPVQLALAKGHEDVIRLLSEHALGGTRT